MASALLESLFDEDALRAADEAHASCAEPRRALVAALLRDGLPRARDEAWKYTSLRALEQRRYARDADAPTRAIDPGAFDLPGIGATRVVFVNGAYRADLSCIPPAAGITITPSGDVGAAQLARLDVEARGAQSRADAFVRLNAVLATGSLNVHVAAGIQAAEPLHLVFAGAPAEADVAWQARTHIELAERATLRVIEHHVGAGANAHFGNLLATCAIAAGARLDLLQIQDAASAATLIRRDQFEIGADAILALHSLETGAQLMRHEIDVDLVGNRARFESGGVFALGGRQHCDTHLDVRHSARDSASAIVWRGVADERARGVFRGAITIAAGADGADAQLSNRNLLLSPDAEIDTQPVLEIHADEVKAAHGATVGQLDEHALFYLRSRGIPLDTARRVLVGAFCNAVFAGIPSDLRAHLANLLAMRRPQLAGTSA